MKKKALLIVLVCVMGLTAIFSSRSEAAGWYACTISQAGSASWGNFVLLTHTSSPSAFSNRMFTLDPAVRNAQLATALSAYGKSKNVLVYLQDPAQYSVVYLIMAMP